MADRASGLAGNRDFGKLWAAKAVSDFGSMVSGTALSFTAILFLKASPTQLGLLMAANLLPRFLVGPAAGLLVDRWPRRKLMIGADLGRALLLATVPAAALFGRLGMWHLYLVTAATALLSLLFDVADRSYLPALVPPEDLVTANSRLTATSSVAEFGAFSLGGWIVQWFTAPVAILIDALTFLFSALSLGMIRKVEARPEHTAHSDGIRGDLHAGWIALRGDAILVLLAWVTLLVGLSHGVAGAVIVAFMARDLGFHPGVLGMIWSIGGIASLGGALFADRLLRRMGVGPALAGALLVAALGTLFVSVAHGATWIAAGLLAAAQLTDAAHTTFNIHETSLRQATIPAHIQGRVNGLFETIGLGAMLAGALVGGLLGERLGLRAVVALCACGPLAAAALIRLSPLWRARLPL